MTREINSVGTISDHGQYQDWNVKLQNEVKYTPEVNFVIYNFVVSTIKTIAWQLW